MLSPQIRCAGGRIASGVGGAAGTTLAAFLPGEGSGEEFLSGEKVGDDVRLGDGGGDGGVVLPEAQPLDMAAAAAAAAGGCSSGLSSASTAGPPLPSTFIGETCAAVSGCAAAAGAAFGLKCSINAARPAVQTRFALVTL